MDDINITTQPPHTTLPCRYGYNVTSIKTCEKIMATLRDGRYFAVILTVLTTYLIIALVVYNWSGDRRKQKKPFVNNLVIASAVVTFLCDMRIIVELYSGNLSDRACTIIHWAGGGLYSIGAGLSYTILWARQRKFYADPLLKAGSVNKVKGMLSTVIIAAIYILTGVNSSVFVSSYTLYANKYGCDVIWDHVATYRFVLPCAITFISAIFLFQIILLYLIVHPLLRTNPKHSTDKCMFISVLFSGSKIDIHRLIKRLAWCASLCVLSSLFMAIMIMLISLDYMRYYWVNFIALDMLINNISTVCTFVDWRYRLFPFCSTFRIKFGQKCTKFLIVNTSDEGENKYDSNSKLENV